MMRFNPMLLECLEMRADEAEELINKHGINRLYEQKYLDAGESLQTARELVQIKKVLYYTQFPQFMADKLCPVSSQGNTGAKNVGYDMLSPTGMAEVVDDDAQDPPVANVKKDQVTQPVVTLKLAIKWNIQDLREAALSQMSGLSANFSFTEEKTRAVLLGIKRKEEDIFVRGDADHNVPGFCNNTNINAQALPTALATVSWAAATSEELVGMLNSLRNSVSTGSKNVFLVNTILMSPAAYDLISTKPFSGTSGTATETVLSFYLRTQRMIVPNFDIINYPYLEGLNSATAYRIIGYFKDPMILNQEIPQPMETFGPITNDGGQTFTTTVRERHAGIQLRYPVACKYIAPLV